jgi:muramoyltetrapeptide carboxypeptidase
VIEGMGFRTVPAAGLFEKKGYLAGDDAHRAQSLERMLRDPSIRAVMCARGGFGSIRTLPLIDFKTLRREPKIFIGSSDATALLAAFYLHAGWITFHGPMVTSLADATPESRTALMEALNPLTPPRIVLRRGITLRGGRAQGPLMGGNLTTLCHLVGTPYLPTPKGHILFLEDRNEATYRIDRMLMHLRLAGWFEGLAGLVLGSFEDCGPLKYILRVFEEILGDTRVPILAGLEAGHGRTNVTLPLGVEASLDADRHTITYLHPATGRRDAHPQTNAVHNACRPPSGPSGLPGPHPAAK